MNAIALPVPSSPLEGGFYAGRINIAGCHFALIVAPKALGEITGQWNRSTKSVDGALSLFDGLANTQAMADAGSVLAKKALALTIDGHSDFYIPSLDEQEICYRAFKPTTEDNSLWNRSGINVSAVPPTYPYTVASPEQTTNELFRAGGAEAYAAEAYWTSSQHASLSSHAWLQFFLNGSQYDWNKGLHIRARVVRRLAI
jgi:hypothetical protein